MLPLAFASVVLAAVPLGPAAGSHSQHIRVTASVQVTRSCSASISQEQHVELSGDCDERDNRDDRVSPRLELTGDQDSRRTYRIDRDDAAGVMTIQF